MLKETVTDSQGYMGLFGDPIMVKSEVLSVLVDSSRVWRKDVSRSLDSIANQWKTLSASK